MGTRGIIGTIHEGVLHGAYNQYDMYPTGAGKDIQHELIATDIVAELLFDELRPMVARMRYVDEMSVPTEEEREQFKDSWEQVSTGKDWYALLRGHQGSLLKRLTAGVAIDRPDFLKDSLFCEWGYIFDFDEKKVLILEGFNQNPDEQWERCKADEEDIRKQKERGDRPYYGCRVAWTGTMPEFLALDMNKLEESLQDDAA